MPAHVSAPVDVGGFALLEVLVGIVMFAIVSAGATMAVIGGVSNAAATQTRVGTANVAQQSVQQAQAMPRASLTATPSVTSTATVGSARYVITRTVGYSPATATACPTSIVTGNPMATPTATPYAVVVHVSVTGTGPNARSVAMDTVIAC